MKAAFFTHGRGMFAYTAGRLCSSRPQYDITAGSGNGAVLATFAICQEYGMLHDFISMTKNEKFYGKHPLEHISNSMLALITSYFKRKSVRKSVIRTFMPYFEKELAPLYYKMMTDEKSMYLSIYNSTKHVVETKRIPNDIAQDRFAKYLMASISHPLLFSGISIGNYEYRSAATVEPMSIQRLMDLGVTDIDIYTNLPDGSLDNDYSGSAYYSLQLLDDNSRYLQLKELRHFLRKYADDSSIRYRIFFIPIRMIDPSLLDVNKYFDKGYIASDLLCIYKG